jgi:hypothetical protein
MPLEKFHKNAVGLKLNRTHQLPLCAHDNLLSKNINITNNKEALFDASKNLGRNKCRKMKNRFMFC